MPPEQVSLKAMWSTCPVSSTVSGSESLECYDFFSGCGGWTTGAVQAGHRVVFACDHSAEALAAHEANHPDAAHLQAELPLPRAQLPFPKDGRPFHVHGSPPCTLFSTMNTRSGDAAPAKRRATRLVRWYLKTALASGCTSWSMEQVPSKIVIGVVRRFRAANLAKMDYGIFDFYDLGVPQRRKRLLAGSPALIARLKRMACHARRRSVRDVLPVVRGTHIRSSLRWEAKRLRHDRKPGEARYAYIKSPNPLHSCHSTKGAAPTVVTSSPLNWVTLGAGEEPILTARELAALQCFPNDYAFPPTQALAKLLIGNSVPPLVARLLMGAES
mgnify:CR=1 FL=1